ncbi:MAG: amidase family protein [Vulcanimicrobiaceae bacterium]
MNRGELLIGASLALVAQAIPALAAPNLDFASASAAALAIRRRRASSVELTQRMFDRIDRYNPQLNAFAYQLRAKALVHARKADAALARGEFAGPLHGVPLFIKESFGVAGQPCTWGIEALRNSKAARNSEVVDRLLGAGAVLLGATNVPASLGDYQTYNAIYGTTSNPWDLKRTPGGSSGGSAAALAAGLGYLSVGSDIGGSIRVPADFCGIYGHKPTLDLVSLRGHSPGGAYDDPGFTTLLAVAGPLARSAEDLLTALQILGGPVAWDKKAWTWKMPPARATAMKEIRVGYVFDDPIAPLSSELAPLFEHVLHSLKRAGATLKPGWPSGFSPRDLLKTYRFMSGAFTFSVEPSDAQAADQRQFEVSDDPAARGALSSFSAWQQQNLRRLAFRAQWQAYFEHVDVFLTPVAFAPAFPHDHSEPVEKRTIDTPDGKRGYWDLRNWIATPTLTGCPATAAPIGHTRSGLPVGIQIMGPFWEDATPIVFAAMLAREIGGFTPPPGY